MMNKVTICTVLTLFSMLFAFSLFPGMDCLAQDTPPYKNPELSVEERVEDLLVRMTIEEKAVQLASFFPNGNVRLGIPHMQAGEALHGVALKHATSFPQAIALGSTWDPGLIKEMANIIAKEARALGVHHVYSPMLGVVRDPRWGRTEESYGEDPYLVSRIGVAFIKGLQGTGEQRFDENHIIATAKHYVADGEPIAGLNGAAFDISVRMLHEIFLPPFKAAVEEARVGSIMPAHHSLNGVPCHANKYLLVDLLRDTYGFDGIVVCDNNDILNLRRFMRVARTDEEAALLSLEAGVDSELAWEQPWDDGRAYGAPLLRGVEEGTIPVSLVDAAARNILTAKFRLGLFDTGDEVPAWQDYAISGDKGSEDYEEVSYSESIRGSDVDNDYFNRLDRLSKVWDNYEEILNDPAHNRKALEVARKAIILLKNDNDVLPLDKNKLSRIAVIGPNADIEVLGGYSTPEARYFVTVLEGIKNFVGNDVEILYSEGASLVDLEKENISEAAAAARKSDIAIVVIGGNELTTKENEDRDDLNLVGKQQELVEAVYATGTPVVVVLLHGRPLSIEWIKNNVPAILDGWYLGQETGNAVAEALFGELNPGGKLPLTVPKNVGQVPLYYNSLPPGRKGRYFDSSAEPLFPFGYGLSYTTFEYRNLSVNPTSATSAEVAIDVMNTGSRAGDEVVQFYVRDEISSRTRPLMELKAFQRITLQPGQNITLSTTLEKDAFAFFEEGRHDWVVEAGEFTIMVGSSSQDIKHEKTIELK